MAVKVDTDVVRRTANEISNLNKTIENDFSAVEHAMKCLNENWEGVAAEIAMRNFQSIKNTCCNSRFDVVNGMVSFMRRQVGEGYESGEAAITSAASAFK